MPRKKKYRIGHPSHFVQLELLVRKCEECGIVHRIDEGYVSADHTRFICVACSIREEKRGVQ